MLALAIWIGGLVSIIAAVIPAVFGTIGMEAGGRMLTKTFQGYDRLALIAAALIVLGTVARTLAAGSWRMQVGTAEFALLAVMILIVGILAFWLGPETTRLQELAFAAKDETKRAAYDEFFLYHRWARALYIVNLALGISLLCVKVRKWVR